MNKTRYDIITFHPRRHHNFEQAARLMNYYDNFKHLTGLYFPPKQVERMRCISPRLAKEMARRSYDFSRPEVIDTCPRFELQRLWTNLLKRPYDYDRAQLNFSHWIVKNYVPPRICLGYDTLSRQVFEQWKGKSFLILDLVIGIPHYRAIIDNGNRYEEGLLESRPPADQNLYRIYERELELADLVLCGSDFVKKTCETFGLAQDKLQVVNYGVDIERFKNPDKIIEAKTKGLKFVFVGAVGYRKGADILVQAWQNFYPKHSDCELHFFGHLEFTPPDNIEGITFHGQVNQLDLISFLKTADIFVFPTTFEGSAYSLYQAMAMKLAVITTENSGTVLEHQKSALLVEIGQSEQIVAAMERLTEDFELRQLFAERAYKKSLEYTWDSYGLKIKSIMDEVLS